jgi:hypothetical protein
MSDIRSLAELKSHASTVGNSYFSKGNARYFGRDKHYGIYRGPYVALSEGYLISEAQFDKDSAIEYNVYSFESGADSIDFRFVGKHESLADAEAFLRSMGATKR